MEAMSKPERYRAKMLRGFIRALDNEELHVRRYRRIGQACSVFGSVVFAIALFAALRASTTADVWFVISGVVAGLLIGLALFFNSSIEQWPVTREFLNVEAIREAARRNQL